jgi:hypothetical protein
MASLEIRELPDPQQRRQEVLLRIAQRWQQRPALQWPIRYCPESMGSGGCLFLSAGDVQASQLQPASG